MSDSTVIFLTGANRGLGKGLVQKYLLRPNHTVIGSVRDKTSSVADELKKLPTAAGSRLLLVKIESTSPADPAEAIKDLQAAGIDHLDIVIANAGGVTGRTVTPVDTVSKEELTESFNINTLGPVFLFQAVKPLLQKSKSPVWVAVTSATGSIGGMEAFGTHNLSAYGIAKAGLNWFTMYAHILSNTLASVDAEILRAVHCSEKWLTAFVLHPGYLFARHHPRAKSLTDTTTALCRLKAVTWLLKTLVWRKRCTRRSRALTQCPPS